MHAAAKHSMHKRILIVALVLITLARTARAEISADQVRTSIDRAMAYLERQQTPSGAWTDHPAYNGGITALCTLALLNCGVEAQDERISRALKYLRGLAPSQTYVVSLQIMVFCAAEPKRDI